MISVKYSAPVRKSRMICATSSDTGTAMYACKYDFLSLSAEIDRTYSNATGMISSAENCFTRNNDSIEFPWMQVNPALANNAIPVTAIKSSRALNSLSFLWIKGFKASQKRHVMHGRNNNTVAIISFDQKKSLSSYILFSPQTLFMSTL